jgi:hypothetical protein
MKHTFRGDSAWPTCPAARRGILHTRLLQQLSLTGMHPPLEQQNFGSIYVEETPQS